VSSPAQRLRPNTPAHPLGAALAAKVAKYAEMFKVTFLSKTAYIYDLLFRQLFLVVVMYVFIQLWKTTYSWEGAVEISGFTIRQMIWYLAMSESIAMGMPAIGATIDEEVKSGSLAYSLNKPYKYALFHYSGYMAEALLRFILSLVIAGTVTWIAVGPPAYTLVSFLAGVIGVLVGLSMNYAVQFGIGLLAFWTEDTWAFRFLYGRLVMIFGGMMLPLDVFPEGLRKIASAMPTSLIIYGPVKTFISFSFSDWILMLGRQGLWLAACSVVVTAVYRLGVKRVNVQGG
jgi:ABC-2 type transport system permease protein